MGSHRAPFAGVTLPKAVGARHELGCSVGWDTGSRPSIALIQRGGDVFALGLLVSNQTTVLAITQDYRWELYSIKIDSRVN